MMQEKTNIISVVVPVFNSASLILELVNRINATFSNSAYKPEIILVNDGSSDSSWLEIEKAKKLFPDTIKAVNFTRNYGQHNAILCGFSFATGTFVITMDDDLQHPPEEILKLIHCEEKTGADIVYGMYGNKHHSGIRNAGSRLVQTTSDFRSKNKGGGSSFRLLKKELADTILQNNKNHFLFLDSVINWYSGNVEVVEVEHHKRKDGRSGYTLGKLFEIYFNIIYHYSTKPLKIITWGGLFFSIITFLIGLRFLYNKFVHDVPLGYTSIIVSILFSTSLILFCLGIIGNYLYKLYALQQNKPPYSIQKVI